MNNLKTPSAAQEEEIVLMIHEMMTKNNPGIDEKKETSNELYEQIEAMVSDGLSTYF